MIRIATLIVLAALVSGCGSSSAGTAATPSPTSASSVPVPTGVTTALPTPPRSATAPGQAPTVAPTPVPTLHPHPTGTAALAPAYMTFIRTLCKTLSSGDASGVDAHLMHYQYNSGLRWGMIGDGEGTTSDPSLMYTWLSGSQVRCRSFSPSNGGHGTLMTVGWAQPGPWSLLDLDLLNGQWVINDFTFGSPARLARAMHSVSKPVMKYRG